MLGEYWRFHLACEYQRLYPGTAQGQYTLGVFLFTVQGYPVKGSELSAA